MREEVPHIPSQGRWGEDIAPDYTNGSADDESRLVEEQSSIAARSISSSPVNVT